MTTLFENVQLLKNVAPFEQHLLGMFPRVRLHPIYDDRFGGYSLHHGTVHMATAVPSTSHEIAHMVEMKDPKRWTLKDWGMPLAIRSFGIPLLARECRVRAIQFYMGGQRQIYENEFVFDAVKYPIAKFKGRAELLEWLQAMEERTKKAWSVDRIEDEWRVRVNHIRNYMETKKEVSHG